MTESALEVLQTLLWGLSDDTIEDDELTVPVDLAADDDRRATFVAYVGLVDILIEDVLAEAPERERVAILSRGLAILGAVEGPLRFAWHERVTTAERQDLVSRMRRKDIALTSEWLLPRLQGDIEAYGRRIDALHRAIDERNR